MDETTVPGTCPNNYTLVRTWTVTDNCGNSATAVQNITVKDNEAPVLAGVPTDEDVTCDGNIPSGEGVVTATDNCDGNVTVVLTEEEVLGACLKLTPL